MPAPPRFAAPMFAVALAAGLLAGCGGREPPPQPQPMMMMLLTPMVPAQPVAATPPGIYTVSRGGTLAAVAARTGASLTDLMALNPTIAPTRRLLAGERVWLPFAWPQ